jgi:hypothetical protein
MAAIPGEEAGNIVAQAQSEATGAIAEVAESLGLIATSAVMEINQILNALDTTIFLYKMPYKYDDGTIHYFEIKLSILRIFGLFAAWEVIRRKLHGDGTAFGHIYEMVIRIMESPQAFTGGIGGLSGIQMPNVGAGIAGATAAVAEGVTEVGKAATEGVTEVGKAATETYGEYAPYVYAFASMFGMPIGAAAAYLGTPEGKKLLEDSGILKTTGGVPDRPPSKQVPSDPEGVLRQTISDEEQRLRDQFIIDRVAGKAQLPVPKPKQTR